MKINRLIITLFLIFVLNANAQEFKLGKSLCGRIEEKVHPKDPTAAAAILFKMGMFDLNIPRRKILKWLP
jgi:hypothetical protein